jgi:hypothetical protein
MVAADKNMGTCHICFKWRKLTYEHVPPKRAFNRFPGVTHSISAALNLKGTRPIGVPLRFNGGMGVRTLCENCNQFTARYYGHAFADWVHQALRYAERYERVDGRENEIILPFEIEPLAVLKQIATMTLAVAEPSSIDALQLLRRFVLMPFETAIPHDICFRVYLNPKKANWTQPQNRMNGVSVIMDVSNGTANARYSHLRGRGGKLVRPCGALAGGSMRSSRPNRFAAGPRSIPPPSRRQIAGAPPSAPPQFKT